MEDVGSKLKARVPFSRYEAPSGRFVLWRMRKTKQPFKSPWLAASSREPNRSASCTTKTKATCARSSHATPILVRRGRRAPSWRANRPSWNAPPGKKRTSAEDAPSSRYEEGWFRHALHPFACLPTRAACRPALVEMRFTRMPRDA